MAKLISLYKRRAGVPVEEFQQELQRQTQRKAVPGLRRYVQSHTLLQGYRKGELIFDAVGEHMFDDAAQALAARDALRAERKELSLADAAASMDMLVDVYVMKGTPLPPNALKSIEFVNRKPSMPLDAFQAHWRQIHGPIGARIPTVLRYEQNHLNAADYASGKAPRFDGVATTWFTSTAEMRRGVDTPEYLATREDEPNFLPEGHLPVVITREVIDWTY